MPSTIFIPSGTFLEGHLVFGVRRKRNGAIRRWSRRTYLLSVPLNPPIHSRLPPETCEAKDRLREAVIFFNLTTDNDQWCIVQMREVQNSKYIVIFCLSIQSVCLLKLIKSCRLTAMTCQPKSSIYKKYMCMYFLHFFYMWLSSCSKGQETPYKYYLKVACMYAIF